MDFDLTESAFNFPVPGGTAGLENRFRDDTDKLHSDLVGVSASLQQVFGSNRDKDDEAVGTKPLEVEDIETQDERLLFSMPLPGSSQVRVHRPTSNYVCERHKSKLYL